MDITLLEITLPDAEFNAPFAGHANGTPHESAPAEEDTDGRSLAAPLAALGVLLGLALLARYLRSRGSAPGDAEVPEVDEATP